MQGWINGGKLLAEDGAEETGGSRKRTSELAVLNSPESMKGDDRSAILRNLFKAMDLAGLSKKENSSLGAWFGTELNHSMAVQIISSLCGEYAKRSVI
jgi:hypothetical protein